MKRFLSLIVACIGMIASYAQSQIATLSHNGEITTFYGAEALKTAHNNAEAGDVITLSAGSFNSVNITKLITIRGAGMGVKVNDTDTYSDPTIIVGDFSVTADGNETNHFTLEGVRNDNRMILRGTNYTQFFKCTFYDVRFEANYGSLQNCTFVHCYVSNSFDALYNTTFTGVNSYFKNADFCGSSSLFTLTNCVVEIESSLDLRYSSLKNCIIINKGSKDDIYIQKDYSTIYYTLWAGVGSEPFKEFGDGHYNYIQSTYDDLFVDGSFYKLTDDAKKYVGSDGKELGIYGGSMPFTSKTSIPQITKCEVAPQSTKEGKLSVNIVVE